MGLAEEIAGWLRGQIEGAGLSGAVLGLSGGIDSAVVAGLCARAVGPENVLGIAMPAHSLPADVEHAQLTAKTFGIDYRVVDLSGIYDAFIELLPPGSQMANANIKPRLRMITLYHFANTMNRMVIGTGNRSELQVGYFTKYGDGGVDLLPIGGLLKTEVRELAREIGVPQVIIERAPSAGLWEGQTDEGEMGITYEQLDRTLAAIEAGDTSDIDPGVLEKVQHMHRTSEHKRKLAPVYQPQRAG
ncbi:MAG TPA: NAD+ synthase [Thermomicrobiales bacterium]|nr:NAD+ synthase [Thermomicrobiales bacterium]